MGFVAVGRETVKQLKLDQATRNLTFGDLEILLLVIGLAVTGLRVVYILGSCTSWGFLAERGEEWWCDFVCVERLGLMIGLLNVGFIDFFSTCGFQY